MGKEQSKVTNPPKKYRELTLHEQQQIAASPQALQVISTLITKYNELFGTRRLTLTGVIQLESNIYMQPTGYTYKLPSGFTSINSNVIFTPDGVAFIEIYMEDKEEDYVFLFRSMPNSMPIIVPGNWWSLLDLMGERLSFRLDEPVNIELEEIEDD